MPMGKIIIPEDIMNKIIKEYKDGLSMNKISKKYPYSYDKIRDSIKEKNIKIRNNASYARKYYCNSDYFSEIDSEEKAYWLGFIFADGYFVIARGNKEIKQKLGIALSEVDKGHLEKFKKNIESTNPIHTYEVTSGYNTDSKYCRIIIDDDKLVSDLMNLGIETHKSGSSNIPNIDKIKNKNYIKAFIRGIFDGDGNIRKNSVKNGGYFKIGFNGTKEILDFIKFHLPIEYNKKYYQRHPDRDNNNYDIDLGDMKSIYEVLNYLYKDSNIHLDRKYDRYKEFMDKFGHRFE